MEQGHFLTSYETMLEGNGWAAPYLFGSSLLDGAGDLTYSNEI